MISTSSISEEKIDIWNNKKEPVKNIQNQKKQDSNESLNTNSSQTVQTIEKIKIEEGGSLNLNDQKVYGIYEPANFDLNLNMWSTTKAEDLRSSLKRLSKINLSKSSNEILEMILFSFSYPPNDMNEKEFVKLKLIG